MPVLEAPPERSIEKEHNKLTPGIDWVTRNSTWIPINPARLDSGAWVSLAKLIGEDKAHPIPLAPSQSMSSFVVIASDISVSLAAKLAIGSIFSGSLNYGDRAFYLDATMFADKYAEIPGNTVVGTRWGVGVRVLLHVTDIKGSIGVGLGPISAAVELGQAKALYEIDGMGIEGGMDIVLSELQNFGNFDMQTYFKIASAVIPKLGQYMRENPSKLKPVPFQVQLIQPLAIDPIVAARSVLFAMHCLSDGRSLNDALAKAATKFETEEIRTVYMKLAPNTPANERPPQSARDAANEWLETN